MHILESNNILLESIGYSSIKDFIHSIVGNSTVYVWGGLASILTYITRFITNNIYDPALGIWILVVLTFADLIVGMSLAIKQKRFDPIKIMRAGTRMVIQIFLVGIVFQICSVWPIVGDWIVDALLLSFVISAFWSIFKNSAELKWIDKNTYDILERILSLEELIRKLFSRGTKSKKDKSNKST